MALSGCWRSECCAKPPDEQFLQHPETVNNVNTETMKPTTLLLILLAAFCLALGASLYQSEARLYSLMTDGCTPQPL